MVREPNYSLDNVNGETVLYSCDCGVSVEVCAEELGRDDNYVNNGVGVTVTCGKCKKPMTMTAVLNK